MGDSLTVLGRKVTSANRAVGRSISAAIKKVVAEGPDESAPLRIERPGRRPLLLDVLPVPNRFDGVFFFARFIVLLTDLDRQPLPSAALLKQAFGLSPAEARIALELTSGLSLTEAAEKCGITRETAKTHLNSVFYKTGTNRQGALVGLVRSVMARRPG